MQQTSSDLEITEQDILINLNIQKKIIKKEWGHEEILPGTGYLFKKLFMKKGCRCSLQLHNYKEETIYVLEGQLRITIKAELKYNGYTDFLLGPGQCFHIAPKMIHRMTGITDCTYLESSTPYPDDVIRIESDYPDTDTELHPEYLN